MPPSDVHALELGRLLRFVGGLAAAVLVVYALPGTDALRPWLPGEPVPLLRFVKGEGKVTEDERGLQAHDQAAPMQADTGAPPEGAAPPLPAEALADAAPAGPEAPAAPDAEGAEAAPDDAPPAAPGAPAYASPARASCKTASRRSAPRSRCPRARWTLGTPPCGPPTAKS
ncbi:MAG: hypothetical protein RL071_4915, partial [Pseudomonadota bacterium]